MAFLVEKFYITNSILELWIPRHAFALKLANPTTLLNETRSFYRESRKTERTFNSSAAAGLLSSVQISGMSTYIADTRRWIAQNHNGWAVVVIDQGPEVTAGAHHRPLRHDVLPGMCVALKWSGRYNASLNCNSWYLMALYRGQVIQLGWNYIAVILTLFKADQS